MRYNGKEVDIIKDYGNWILVQHPKGYKEGINKQDLGLVIKREKPTREGYLSGITGIRV